MLSHLWEQDQQAAAETEKVAAADPIAQAREFGRAIAEHMFSDVEKTADDSPKPAGPAGGTKVHSGLPYFVPGPVREGPRGSLTPMRPAATRRAAASAGPAPAAAAPKASASVKTGGAASVLARAARSRGAQVAGTAALVGGGAGAAGYMAGEEAGVAGEKKRVSDVKRSERREAIRQRILAMLRQRQQYGY